MTRGQTNHVVNLPSQSSCPARLCKWCRLEIKQGDGQLADNDLLKGSREVAEQSAQESQPKQDEAAAFADQAAASPENLSTLPPKSAEANASALLGTGSAASSDAASDSSRSHASNSKTDDSTSAEPQTGDEAVTADVQQADSVSGSDGSQPRQAAQPDQATTPEAGSNISSPVTKSSGLAGTSTGADGNGEHGDDDARSVRSQDTTTSRASKMQASEMSRLQV